MPAPKKAAVPAKVAKAFTAADKGKGLLKRKKK